MQYTFIILADQWQLWMLDCPTSSVGSRNMSVTPWLIRITFLLVSPSVSLFRLVFYRTKVRPPNYRFILRVYRIAVICTDINEFLFVNCTNRSHTGDEFNIWNLFAIMMSSRIVQRIIASTTCFCFISVSAHVAFVIYVGEYPHRTNTNYLYGGNINSR